MYQFILLITIFWLCAHPLSVNVGKIYFWYNKKIDQKSLNVIRVTIISIYDPTYLFEAEIGHSPPWDTVAGAEVIIVINTRKPEGLHSLRKHCVGYVSGYSSTDQTRPVDADDPGRNESGRITVSIDTIVTSVTSQYDYMTSQSNQRWCCHANTVSRPMVRDLGCVPHRLSWRPSHALTIIRSNLKFDQIWSNVV